MWSFKIRNLQRERLEEMDVENVEKSWGLPECPGILGRIRQISAAVDGSRTTMTTTTILKQINPKFHSGKILDWDGFSYRIETTWSQLIQYPAVWAESRAGTINFGDCYRRDLPPVQQDRLTSTARLNNRLLGSWNLKPLTYQSPTFDFSMKNFF